MKERATSQVELAAHFRALHRPGDPLLLYNVWDAAGARAVAKAGASALATSSAAVALAHGSSDGEHLPLDAVVAAATAIVGAVSLPVSVDIEMGYGADAHEVGHTIERLVRAGAIGVNIEDRAPAGGLRPIAEQCERLARARGIADALRVPLFINARTDVFFRKDAPGKGAKGLAEVLERADAYAESGADGLFVPGLLDLDLVRDVCAKSPLPVNVLVGPDAPPVATLALAGVARVSTGHIPLLVALRGLEENARAFFANGTTASLA